MKGPATLFDLGPSAKPPARRPAARRRAGAEGLPPGSVVPRALQAFLGIDPGLGGGLALIEPDGALVACWDTPVLEGAGPKGRREYDRQECWTMLRSAAGLYPGLRVVLEQLQPIPMLSGPDRASSFVGVHTAFRLGSALELWTMACVGVGVPLERVPPKRWQKVLGTAPGEKASLARAREMFPGAPLQLEKHSGRAAALLLAEYGRRVLA